MPLAAMSSFIVSYRQTELFGIANQIIDCEWSAEVDHAGGIAYSARISLAHGATYAIDPASVTPGASGLRAIAVKASEGDVDISCGTIEANLPAGASACWSSSTPAPSSVVNLSTSSTSAIAEIVLISAAGG